MGCGCGVWSGGVDGNVKKKREVNYLLRCVGVT